MDNLIKAAMKRWMIPGLAWAIVRDGQLACAQGFGLADVASAKPVAELTVYPLASVTKIFTATAIMLLVENGLLSLYRAVAEILTGLPSEKVRQAPTGHRIVKSAESRDLPSFPIPRPIGAPIDFCFGRQNIRNA